MEGQKCMSHSTWIPSQDRTLSQEAPRVTLAGRALVAGDSLVVLHRICSVVIGCGGVLVPLGSGRPGKHPWPGECTNEEKAAIPKDTFMGIFRSSSAVWK